MKIKNYLVYAVISLLTLSVLTLGQGIANKQNDKALLIVQSAADALGGVEKLKSIKSLKVEGVSFQNHIMDSEHPDGPYFPDYSKFTELQNFDTKTLRRDGETTFPTDQKINLTTTISGEFNLNKISADGGEPQTRLTPAEPEWFLRNPGNAVLAALEAKDLQLEKEEITQSVPHYVVSFTWQKTPVRIFINKYNNLPTAVETVRSYPYEILRNGWGDFAVRAVFTFWNLEPGGFSFPHQVNIEWNGYPYQTVLFYKVEINPSITVGTFQIPAEEVKNYTPRRADDIPLGNPNLPAKEIAPNVIQIPGGWYSTIVRQSDGIIIIEAPISSGYSAKVIAEAKRRFPNVPIKGVITTTNFWWHFAGLREYAAEGIPIYALDLNQKLLESFLSAPHRIEPDSLSKSGRKFDLKLVGAKHLIGEGDNQLEVYPIRQAASQMLIVYLRKQKLLYTAEMAQPLGPGGTFLYPFDLASVMRAVKELNLDVETLIGMHMSPTPYKKLVETVEDTRNQKIDAK